MYSDQRIVITTGEPAGIGPDLVVSLACQDWPVELVVCAEPTLLLERAYQLNIPLTLCNYQPWQPAQPQRGSTLTVLPIPTVCPVTAGKTNVRNSAYVLETLARACDGCLNREFAALVTGPVSKGVINDAGIPFSGHTEFFAYRSSCARAVMMLVTEELRVALVTNHLPLTDVPSAINEQCLFDVIHIINRDLKIKFGITQPHIYVCGLNPHAGEGGHIGHEELTIIIPALDALRKDGIHLTGPLPADTLFQPKYLRGADVVLSMYHDQGLPVLKYHGFGRAVNITLGLPFIRTSVDHGTALELAGTGAADAGSLKAALNLAIKIMINFGDSEA